MQIVTFRLEHTGIVTICLQIILQLCIKQQPTEISECAFVKKRKGKKEWKRKERKERNRYRHDSELLIFSERPKCQQAKLKILKIPEETLLVLMLNSTAHLAKNFSWTSKAWPKLKEQHTLSRHTQGKVLAPSESMLKLSLEVQETPAFKIWLLQTSTFHIFLQKKTFWKLLCWFLVLSPSLLREVGWTGLW